MSVAFPSQASVLERIYEQGSADYLDRANTHTRNATAKQRAHTTPEPDGDGFLIKWESAQQLRDCVQEHELAEQCHQLFMRTVYWRNRALLKAYCHAQLCAMRSKHAMKTPVMTLAEVTQTFTTRAKLCRDHSPPGEVSRPVLSLCHASNAPGLTPVHAWRQRPS